jgi:simple sugar transport system permease protein
MALLLAIAITSLILMAAGAAPADVYKNLYAGSWGDASHRDDVAVSWVPLMLVTAGLLATFAAGLWNIGVEGQITLGAIATTWVLRELGKSDLPAPFVIALSILAGALGGAVWAALAGALKTFGGVNEIFGGLGLNFVATAVTIFLIFGPWKRPGTGSMSGTQPFDPALNLYLWPGLRLSPWALALALLAIVLIYLLLQGTYFGLRLKAVGRNSRSAFRLGIPTWQYTMLAFCICGAFAGISGAMQVTAVYHRLIPSISSGYGYTGLMVAMLANYGALWAAGVAVFFAALNIGGIQLPIVLKLDSSLAGVLQGFLVLFFLMMQGVGQRLVRKT